MTPRPSESFDRGLQHERTALAWERTAITVMIVGLVLARAAAVDHRWAFAAIGVAQTVAGSGLMVWAGLHYDDLHGPLRRGDDVVHPQAARVVGLLTVVGSGTGLTFAVVAALR